MLVDCTNSFHFDTQFKKKKASPLKLEKLKSFSDNQHKHKDNKMGKYEAVTKPDSWSK